ncbi:MULTISPECIES: TraB/GumN family protein [Burkholderia]|uniref:TraB/GumN family protein n=2 Tax=Burkholderiaceae TaxID=119060 RepID=UPI0015886053|nr:TraB/GumN family protein [Burkholderia ambifaria]
MAAVAVASSATIAVAAAPGVPVLRVTAPSGQSSILIGTLHVAVDGLNQPAPSIFAGARHYVVEHTGIPTLPDNQAPAPGATREWAKTLTDAEINIYLERAKCGGWSEQSARELLAEPTPHEANALAYTICPFPRSMSRDNYLATIAPFSLTRATEVLEDANWVESQRRMVPPSGDIPGFKWALAHDPKSVLEQTRDLLNAGNYDGIRAQVLESMGTEDAAAAYTKHMVDERNAAWLPRLGAILNDGNAVVVVGAMHFPGPTGLISLLRQRGYVVQAISWPSAPVGTPR